ncbi:MAG: hypothetical protein CVV18_03005 [Gammaproteobacteria bacterium HGW-Gammaproteobacteria-8]|nr:MAG: hypothetical protein CVV18_03005 [Gammaproteobacteria bacterium HGW-Gammaproteobacteria-8]
MNHELSSRRPRSSRELRQQIVGKCISGVVARAGQAGEPPTVLLLQFDDGSVLEFISPRSDRVLRAALANPRRAVSRTTAPHPDQLALAVA